MTLQIDTEAKLNLNISSVVGRSVAVLGVTGSGKTNTAAVLIEELLAQGLPMTIIDIEGEYWGLKERFEILVAGRSEQSELLIGPENAAQLAEISLTRGISVILDLSEYTQEESYAFLITYFTRLWEVAGKERKPYQIVLEEAHEYLPQSVNTPLKQILTRIALRGRKRGLGMMLMSQRSAKVEKDVVTQTSLLFLHKVIHPTDMKIYKDLIPLPGAEVERLVGALQPGQVVVVSNHVPLVVQIRVRHTFHAGSTPVLGENAQPALLRIDETLLYELQQMIATSLPAVKDEKRLERRIKELEAALVEKDTEIAKRDEQIALLSRLTVEMNGSMPQELQIEQATVHQVQMPALAASSVPHVVEADVANTRDQIVPKQIVLINEAKIQLLQRRISQMSTQQFHILKLLVEQEKALSVDEIAAWLNLDRSTVNKNIPPEALFTLGLLKRTQKGHAYLYRSTLKEYFAKEFLGADVEQLQRRLFS